MARFGRSRRQSASSMFADYNTNAAPSFTEQARARRDAEERNTDPFCCCCKSSHVLITCNTATFIFSIGLILMGAFVNNEVKGWKLAMFDMLGNLCLAVGAFIAVVSILGIMAGRTKARIFMFVYFMLVLMVAVLLVLIVVFIATENDKIDFFLRENWEEVQKVVGVDVDVDDAASLLHDYFYVIAAVASTGCGINIASIGAAARCVAHPRAILGAQFFAHRAQFSDASSRRRRRLHRMLGVRVIAYSFLASIAVLGGGGIYIAYATRGDVPKATTWLLYASGAVQALCGVCGIVGFKNLNRECMRWTFIILALSSFGLGCAQRGAQFLAQIGSQFGDAACVSFAPLQVRRRLVVPLPARQRRDRPPREPAARLRRLARLRLLHAVDARLRRRLLLQAAARLPPRRPPQRGARAVLEHDDAQVRQARRPRAARVQRAERAVGLPTNGGRGARER